MLFLSLSRWWIIVSSSLLLLSVKLSTFISYLRLRALPKIPRSCMKTTVQLTRVSKTNHLATGLRHLSMWLTWIQELSRLGY
jgi:hypothetical protein